MLMRRCRHGLPCHSSGHSADQRIANALDGGVQFHRAAVRSKRASSSARLYAAAVPFLKPIAQIDGPCSRAKRCAKESGSALIRKFTPPWRYSVTSLAMLGDHEAQQFEHLAQRGGESGAAYSMNSNPAVPIGLSQSWKALLMSLLP